MYIISQCSTLYSNCTSHPGADRARCLLRIKSHYYYSNCAHEECWSKPSARAILWQGSTLQCIFHKDTLWFTFTSTQSIHVEFTSGHKFLHKIVPCGTLKVPVMVSREICFHEKFLFILNCHVIPVTHSIT